jgi:hypothetical protein
MLRGLLRWGREGSEEGVWVFHRVGLSLRGVRIGTTTPIPSTQSEYSLSDFPYENLTATICLTIAVLLGSVALSWSAYLVSSGSKEN